MPYPDASMAGRQSKQCSTKFHGVTLAFFGPPAVAGRVL